MPIIETQMQKKMESHRSLESFGEILFRMSIELFEPCAVTLWSTSIPTLSLINAMHLQVLFFSAEFLIVRDIALLQGPKYLPR